MVCMVSFFLAEQEREKLPHIVLGGALIILGCVGIGTVVKKAVAK
jgi:hypothetical protein